MVASVGDRHLDGMNKPRSHALRTGRWSEPGRVYLVTFTTYCRVPRFLAWPETSCAARMLASPTTWPHVRLLCWVLMPDHWHGLIELGNEPLSLAVRRAKAITLRQWNQAHARPERLWAQGFHDHALRKEEDLLQVARYIVTNPLRADLVKRVGNYPFWDAIWL
jgi:putative transposase